MLSNRCQAAIEGLARCHQVSSEISRTLPRPLRLASSPIFCAILNPSCDLFPSVYRRFVPLPIFSFLVRMVTWSLIRI